MLGQHVYIEMDEGQEDQKTGIWLGEYYIVDADTDSPYVWAVDSKGKLEKRSVILGQYDENLSEYEIADGLTEDDSIAFPSDSLVEGMSTRDMSEMTDEELENIDMETNLDNSDYSDGDIMEPVEEDDSSADFESGVIDDSMDAVIDGDYSEDDSGDYSEDMVDDSTFDDSTEDFTDDSIDEPGQYGSEDTEAAG